jgi:uncharacterized membrane protein
MVEVLIALFALAPLALFVFVVVRVVMLGTQVKSLAERLARVERVMDGREEGPLRQWGDGVSPSMPIDEGVRPPVTDEGVRPPMVDVDVHRPVKWTGTSTDLSKASSDLAASDLSKAAERTTPWEELVGGKLLNRIGALALILAMGFFLKYAFDNNWISEGMRVGIGALAGIGLIAGAERSERRGLAVFAQGLAGAGIAILYLSVYASFNFYHLVPQLVAFALMSLVTIGTFAIALRAQSLAVALLGALGGFLTPFLLSTGSSQEVALLTYILLLDIGILAVVAARPAWVLLGPIAMGASWLTLFAWYAEYFYPAAAWITLAFIALFWLLFTGADLLRTRGTAADTPIGITAVLHMVFAALALLLAVDSWTDWARGGMVLCAAALHGAAAFVAQVRLRADRFTIARYALAAVVLVLVASAIVLEGFVLVMVWTGIALLLLEAGVRRQVASAWVAGLVVAGLAGLQLVAAADAPVDAAAFLPILNLRALAFALLAGTAALGAHRSAEAPAMAVATRRVFGHLLRAAAVLLVFVLLTLDHGDLVARLGAGADDRAMVRNLAQMSLSGLWLLYSVALMAWGMLRRAITLRVAAIAVFAISILKIFVVDLAFLETLYRIFSFLALGVILLGVSYLYTRYKDVLFGGETPPAR